MSRFKRDKKPSKFIPRLIFAGICGITLVSVTFTVPRHEGALDFNDRGIEGGPDSYFRHIYDPQHFLGPLGNIDLELDNFQRATGNSIIFAAFPSLPSLDSDFTMRVADSWAPSKKAEDRGVIIFLFMKEKKIRVEVGYGYEDVLTDITTKHIIESTMIVPLRAGQMTVAVEAATRTLQERITEKSATPEEYGSLRSELPSLIREIKRRAALVVKIWFHGNPLLRLVLGGSILYTLVIIAWMLKDLVIACRNFVLFVYHSTLRHDVNGARSALASIAAPLTNIMQAVVLIFILGTIGEYYRGGSGMFGGGGINLFW